MKKHDAIRRKLKQFGLSHPEAHGKSQWPDHADLAVRNRTFAYLGQPGQPLGISCKLRRTCQMALTLPYARPTGYGLGKSGWVTAAFAAGVTPPLDMPKDWIDQSHRAQAPKALVKSLPPDRRR